MKKLSMLIAVLGLAFSATTAMKLERGNGPYFCPGCGQWAVHPHVCPGRPK